MRIYHGKNHSAQFIKGVIKPLEKIELEEGKEIIVTIINIPKTRRKGNPFAKAAGAWKGSVDCDELIKNIYENRLIATRPQPKR